MPLPRVAWPGAWWRRDARTSCSAAVPVVKRRRRRGGISKPKRAALARPREPERAAPVQATRFKTGDLQATRFKTGDLVVIDGLISKPELNGCKAFVRGSDPAKQRLVLELLHHGTQISVKTVNCRDSNDVEANEAVAESAENRARPQESDAHLQAELEPLPKLAECDRLEAPAAAQQAAEKEEEIEEIFTPSVAADLRRERRERRVAQGLVREGESGEEESEEESGCRPGFIHLGESDDAEGESGEFDSDEDSEDSDEGESGEFDGEFDTRFDSDESNESDDEVGAFYSY